MFVDKKILCCEGKHIVTARIMLWHRYSLEPRCSTVSSALLHCFQKMLTAKRSSLCEAEAE